MDTLHLISGALTILSAFFLTIGFVRPSYAVWWFKESSRFQVMTIWGTLLFLGMLGFFLTIPKMEDTAKDETRTQSYHLETEISKKNTSPFIS